MSEHADNCTYWLGWDRCDCARELTPAEKATNHETWKHIHQVRANLTAVVERLMARMLAHDQSKLAPPEVEVFTEYTPKLAGSTYGSDEYREMLAEMRPAIEHHNAHNSHHPEHYEDGVDGMDLLDLIEMLADWKAATMRHEDGDIRRSLEINRERFGISDQLSSILTNTVERMGWAARRPAPVEEEATDAT